MTGTVQETMISLHEHLCDYIEATYHIASPGLIRQRRNLLEKPGVIHQVPYIESTPRYLPGKKFKDIQGIESEIAKLFSDLSEERKEGGRVFYDPPYFHQSESLEQALVYNKNIMIMTGTGSGKTESFLLPILGRLACEALGSPESFSAQNAVRALVLYPMNALVNDQLGRLRTLFSDARLQNSFLSWAERIPTFARYTSRTPYAGVRTKKKDIRKLKPFDDFYLSILRKIKNGTEKERVEAKKIFSELNSRGKWPAKPDLLSWYGAKNSPWVDPGTGRFLRANQMPMDSELITRHEVQASPPDLLVTNYSMLEYMLMRPIEMGIFEKTKLWLKKYPEERFVVVLDEAHLYRGSAGAEVGLLLRRLKDRLDVDESRIQFICATASFNNKEMAPAFGAKLTGSSPDSFVSITGKIKKIDNESHGDEKIVEILSRIDVDSLYSSNSNDEKIKYLKPFLSNFSRVDFSGDVSHVIYEAIKNLPVLNLLINKTMDSAVSMTELPRILFPQSDIPKSIAATSSLLALASMAKKKSGDASLLPCRIHNFFRGLPGLWVCTNDNCSELIDSDKTGFCGKLYDQPIERCGCGARVLELYTCRHCGTAYAKGYTKDVLSPDVIWSKPGFQVQLNETSADELAGIDLLLEEPLSDEGLELASFDTETGKINPDNDENCRAVYLVRKRTGSYKSEGDEDEPEIYEASGEFNVCAICNGKSAWKKSPIQDHVTKGDQPFQALLMKQLQVQPPNNGPATLFAPLQGRKVLAFADSRQVAARLAPNLQLFSTRDSLRALLAYGFKALQSSPIAELVSCNDLFLAALVSSHELNARLRPELRTTEAFNRDEVFSELMERDVLNSSEAYRLPLRVKDLSCPDFLLSNMLSAVTDQFYGFEALAIASFVEVSSHSSICDSLPKIPGLAESSDSKLELLRVWIRFWVKNKRFWLSAMPGDWWQRKAKDGANVQGSKTGNFKAMKKLLSGRSAQTIFQKKWLPVLLERFTEQMSGGDRRLKASEITITFSNDWRRCETCKSVHRDYKIFNVCIDCGSECVSDVDFSIGGSFRARKGFYRNPIEKVLRKNPAPPFSIVAAEHTAQLNSADSDDVFSRAEENEILFQDVNLKADSDGGRNTAVDVLCSTTTMEVGIDIGALSGVALRNMPPGRANYQQRSGRAGRRGNAIATVVAFGSSDSHDEHYFSDPEKMIRGNVVDPVLTLDNADIAKRHVFAFLIQHYCMDRFSRGRLDVETELFSVLGSIEGFLSKDSIINRYDFEEWMLDNKSELQRRLAVWLPVEIDKRERSLLIENMVDDCVSALDDALIDFKSIEEIPVEIGGDDKSVLSADDDVQKELSERATESDNGSLPLSDKKLLYWLLYKAVLPRYAFPTDVATFHVFDQSKSTEFKTKMMFSPSQSLPVALSQYAPGKDIWISNKCYTSGAIYSTFPEERYRAWQERRLYTECSLCGHANLQEFSVENRGDSGDCPACGSEGTFGPSRSWLRPPGFAHPVGVEELISSDEIPETSYATRARLTLVPQSDKWVEVCKNLRAMYVRKNLIVSNLGPSDKGYKYCTKCGKIESESSNSSEIMQPHSKPFPTDSRNRMCEGRVTRALVLGCDFKTDIALFSISVASPVFLKPGKYPTQVALRTVCEALSKAGSRLLDIEPNELQAEYRVSNTEDGRLGLSAEIFIFDTLPGGAGFAAQLVEKSRELFSLALNILRSCSAGCDSSCYRCLRVFSNKFDHAFLDRHVGICLLEYVLNGEIVDFDSGRVESATHDLLMDLLRHDLPYAIRDNEELLIGGQGKVSVPILVEGNNKIAIIAISGPLSETLPVDVSLRPPLSVEGSPVNVITVSELLVKTNLPAATQHVISSLTSFF